MPFALLIAQASGVAQRPGFIVSILVIASIVPVQVYLNEVFAPRAVRYKRGIGFAHGLEVGLGALLLTAVLAYQLILTFISFLLVAAFVQGYIWFSYHASRLILESQASAVIGGRYSYAIGAIIPLVFLLFVFIYWLTHSMGLDIGYACYLLILLPNMLQYLFIRNSGIVGITISTESLEEERDSHDTQVWVGFFIVAMLMALVTQHWKVELADSSEGFAALSVYLVVPFSSAWLILSKSSYLMKEQSGVGSIAFWGGPVLVALTLFFTAHNFIWAFLLALSTQVLTFKFITDTRVRVSAI